MIKEMKALSMTEASKYIESEEHSAFVKKFIRAKEKDAEKIREELEGLKSIKMRDEHIAKIIDLMPEDAQDVSKIFNDISLDDNETKKVLEIVKKYN